MNNKFLKSIILFLFIIIGSTSAYISSNNIKDKQISSTFELKNWQKLEIPNDIKAKENFYNFIDRIQAVSDKTDTVFVFRSFYEGSQNDNNGNVDWKTELAKINFYGHPISIPKNDIYSHGVLTQFSSNKLEDIDFEQYQYAKLFIKNNNNKFLQELNQQTKDFSDNKITLAAKNLNMLHEVSPIMLNNSNLSVTIGFSLIFYFVFLFTWLVKNNKKIIIYRLNGWRYTTIINKILIKELLISFISIAALMSLFVLHTFYLPYMIQLTTIFLATYLISYFAIFIVSRFSMANQINDKSFFKRSYIFLYFIKILIFAVSLATSADSLLLLHNLPHQQENKNIENYASLYPRISGYNSDAPMPVENKHFYSQFEKMGGLLVQAYESRPLDSSYHQSIINSNIVDNFKLSSKPLILISNKIDSSSLREKIKNSLLKDDYLFNQTDYEFARFNPSQQFSKLKKFKLEDSDILFVVNSQNISSTYLSNLLISDNSLYFPENTSLSKIYSQIKPALIADGTLSQVPSLIRVSQIPKINVLLGLGNPVSFVLIQLFLFIMFFTMIMSTTSFYIQCFKKKIAINRLQGLSWFRVYAPFLSLLLIQSAVGLLNAFLTGSSLAVFELLAIYSLLELLIIYLMIRRIERKDLLVTLKGQ